MKNDKFMQEILDNINAIPLRDKLQVLKQYLEKCRNLN